MIVSIWVFCLLGEPLAGEHGTPYVQHTASPFEHDYAPEQVEAETLDELPVYTYLTDRSDAIVMAQRYQLISGSASLEVEFEERGAIHIEDTDARLGGIIGTIAMPEGWLGSMHRPYSLVGNWLHDRLRRRSLLDCHRRLRLSQERIELLLLLLRVRICLGLSLTLGYLAILFLCFECLP